MAHSEIPIRNRQYYTERRERRKRKKRMWNLFRLLFTAALAVSLVFCLIGYVSDKSSEPHEPSELPDWVMVELLTPNRFSRPGIALKSIEGIVVHYTANPGTTAEQNRDYFESLATSGDAFASSHFIIGIDGEIIQCIPLTEISYCSNERNSDTISIECCHKDESGEFSESTYYSLVKLTKWLMEEYDISSKNVIRHYDVTGKCCPKYYVDHPEEWQKFVADLN